MYGDPDYRKARSLTVNIDYFKNELRNKERRIKSQLYHAENEETKLKLQGKAEMLREIIQLAQNKL